MFCEVCGAKGAAKHFNGVCCDRCRSFFRRVVRLSLCFSCANGGRCEVTPDGRKSCRACRFQRCLSIGMDPKLVQSPRNRDADYRKKRPVDLSVASPDSSSLIDCSLPDRRGLQFEKFNGPLGFRSPVSAAPLSADLPAVLRFFRDADRFVETFEEAGSPQWTLEISVDEAFLHAPRRLSTRTKIAWAPLRVIAADMFVPVWCRNIVHYTDLISHIPKLRLMDSKDQVLLLAKRCIPSLWLLLLQRTLRNTKKKCILTTTGDYFPLESEELKRFKGEGFAAYALEIGSRVYDWLKDPLEEQIAVYQDSRMISALLFNVDQIRGTFTHDFYMGFVFSHIGKKFFEYEEAPEVAFDLSNGAGLRGAYIAAFYAAKLMVPRKSGQQSQQSQQVSEPQGKLTQSLRPPLVCWNLFRLRREKQTHSFR
ncbi:hypothetical protein M3Y99_00656500 [Aphelenchoides fujianensis]|nr:hypothetical protein M3Y99_00656500 [Aphelenchoides fujianensis]